MWYGQKETDKIIAKYFPDGYIGNAIEVGVADGIKGSNTKYFEDMGWDVLCIDPIPEHIISAKKCRKNVLECACSNFVGYKDFFVVNLGQNNIKSSLSALEIDSRLLVSHGKLINSVDQLKVRVDKLDNILEKNNWPKKIDFISIDTEGTELDVLKGINLARYQVDLLVVENNFPDDKKVSDYLYMFGYIKVERYFVNDFYKKV